MPFITDSADLRFSNAGRANSVPEGRKQWLALNRLSPWGDRLGADTPINPATAAEVVRIQAEIDKENLVKYALLGAVGFAAWKFLKKRR